MENCGNNIYRIEIPAEAQYIIFNNGSSQTSDIRLEGINKIYNGAHWETYP